jgi:hypothetical protein
MKMESDRREAKRGEKRARPAMMLAAVASVVCSVTLVFLLGPYLSYTHVDEMLDEYADLNAELRIPGFVPHQYTHRVKMRMESLFNELAEAETDMLRDGIVRGLKYGDSEKRLAVLSLVLWMDRYPRYKSLPTILETLERLFSEDEQLAESLLRDDDPDVRSQFGVALVILNSRALMPLVKEIVTGHPDTFTRLRLVTLLHLYYGEGPTEEIDDILRTACEDSSAVVRRAACVRLYWRYGTAELAKQLVRSLREVRSGTWTVMCALRTHDEGAQELYDITAEQLESEAAWEAGLPEALLRKWEEWAESLPEE